MHVVLTTGKMQTQTCYQCIFIDKTATSIYLSIYQVTTQDLKQCTCNQYNKRV
jgi:hypothetical protein